MYNQIQCDIQRVVAEQEKAELLRSAEKIQAKEKKEEEKGMSREQKRRKRKRDNFIEEFDNNKEPKLSYYSS